MKADGTPDLANIVFDSPEAKWNVEGARPVVKGAASLGGEWQPVTEENKAGFRFFNVDNLVGSCCRKAGRGDWVRCREGRPVGGFPTALTQT